MHFLLLLFFFIFSLQKFPYVFPARTTPASTTTATAFSVDINPREVTFKPTATWQDFYKFVNLEKGTNNVTGISNLKRYFHRFGYLPPTTQNLNFSNNFDTELESAILTYQKNLGLPVTGRLDSDTVDQIMSPRCGLADNHTRSHHHPAILHETRRFAYFAGRPRWVESNPITLTYALDENHKISYLPEEEIKSVFRRAFTRWSEVIPVNFTEAREYEKADIKIGFHKGDHGDGEPFDGVLGVLAHAFSPENGRLHLDGAETWAVDFGTERSSVAVDLESVVTHEIGHVLGLAHSSVKDAIMYPSLRPRSKKVDLRVDDVEGVQALYGSNPNFNYGELLESEETSSGGSSGGLISGGLVGVAWLIQFMLL